MKLCLQFEAIWVLPGRFPLPLQVSLIYQYYEVGPVGELPGQQQPPLHCNQVWFFGMFRREGLSLVSEVWLVYRIAAQVVAGCKMWASSNGYSSLAIAGVRVGSVDRTACTVSNKVTKNHMFKLNCLCKWPKVNLPQCRVLQWFLRDVCPVWWAGCCSALPRYTPTMRLSPVDTNFD